MTRQPAAGSRGPASLGGAGHVLLAVAFFFFDRDAGRRRTVVAGLGTVVVMVASHVAMTGPWVRKAGRLIGIQPAATAAAAPAGPVAPVAPVAPAVRAGAAAAGHAIVLLRDRAQAGLSGGR